MFFMDKKGQFFLLAAVIISVIVISIGVTTNRAVVQTEPTSFYDFSYEVEREVGEVFNYEVYSEVSGGELDEFVFLMAEEIQDEDPSSGFVFIFGNNTNLTVDNYDSSSIEIIPGSFEEPADEDVIYYRYLVGPSLIYEFELDNCYNYPETCQMCVMTGDQTSPEDECISTIEVHGDNEPLGDSGGIDGQDMDQTWCDRYRDDCSESLSLSEGTEEVTIIVDGASVVIPVSPYAQVYFISRKEVGNDSYVIVS